MGSLRRGLRLYLSETNPRNRCARPESTSRAPGRSGPDTRPNVQPRPARMLLDAGCERLGVPDARHHRAQLHALAVEGGVDAGAYVEAAVAADPASCERLPAAVVADLDRHRPTGPGTSRAHPAVDAHDARPVRAGGVQRGAA